MCLLLSKSRSVASILLSSTVRSNSFRSCSETSKVKSPSHHTKRTTTPPPAVDNSAASRKSEYFNGMHAPPTKTIVKQAAQCVLDPPSPRDDGNRGAKLTALPACKSRREGEGVGSQVGYCLRWSTSIAGALLRLSSLLGQVSYRNNIKPCSVSCSWGRQKGYSAHVAQRSRSAVVESVQGR